MTHRNPNAGSPVYQEGWDRGFDAGWTRGVEEGRRLTEAAYHATEEAARKDMTDPEFVVMLRERLDELRARYDT